MGYNADEDGRKLGSVPPGSVILLRGGPGCGKTTLALQILNEFLMASDHVGVFVSLERPPAEVVNYVENEFKFGNLRDRLELVGRDRLEESLVELRHPRDTGYEFADQIQEIVKRFKTKRSNPAVLVVVDSLMLLIDMMRSRGLPNEDDLRLCYSSIHAGVKAKLKNAVTLFIGEELASRGEATLIHESFFSDVEIVMASERIVSRPSRSSGLSVPVGYAVERTLAPPEGGRPLQAIFSRSFLRVTKHRFLPNHSRRLAYDIVDGHGIVFYETYPGDGQVMLFFENEIQKSFWEDFAKHEIPLRYPAIRFETFDVKGLQRTFASQRRFKHIPERIDLSFCSFDTYWIKWYVELYQRGDINENEAVAVFLRGLFNTDEKRRRCAPEIICILHETLLSDGAKKSGIASKAVAAYLRDQNVRFTKNSRNAFQNAFKSLEKHFSSESAYQGVLEPVHWERLRLFGEKCSDFVGPLRRDKMKRGHPVHFLPSRQDSRILLSVPYNANVGFAAFRKDQLNVVCSDPKSVESLREDILRVFEEGQQEVREFCASKEFKSFCSHKTAWQPEKPATLKPELYVDGLLGRLATHEPPSTWEEVIAICKKLNGDLLIETTTFDTFTTTFLEMVWGCGGEILVTPGYKLTKPTETAVKVFEASCLLRRLFCSVTPRHASLDPNYVRNKYAPTVTKPTPSKWVFGRFWYSTLVDLLTRREAADKDDDALQNGDFVWKEDAAQLEIMPLPVSLSNYIAQRESGKTHEQVRHESCWGEWHFGILRGSENEALGVDLINYLMSSHKICERAFACASLPTVERFYELYGKTRCFDVAGRSNEQLPTISFAEIKSKFLESARARSEIFDYRHSNAGTASGP